MSGGLNSGRPAEGCGERGAGWGLAEQPPLPHQLQALPAVPPPHPSLGWTYLGQAIIINKGVSMQKCLTRVLRGGIGPAGLSKEMTYGGSKPPGEKPTNKRSSRERSSVLQLFHYFHENATTATKQEPSKIIHLFHPRSAPPSLCAQTPKAVHVCPQLVPKPMSTRKGCQGELPVTKGFSGWESLVSP